MKTPYKFVLLAACVAIASTTIMITLAKPDGGEPALGAAVPTAGQSALTVEVDRLQPATFPLRVVANGNIVAWQEASIGSEANGLRLAEVKVNVGDTVRRGQTLAIFAPEALEAELAQGRAAVAEASVALAEAVANARRARVLQDSGTLSDQQIQQYITAEGAARARLDSTRAVERAQALRLAQAWVVAPDDGIISARTATVGAVMPNGQELFRLIRGRRLEWRAEVAATDMARLKAGQKVRITPKGGDVIEGRLRMLAPVVDIETRNGLVYVDLSPSDTARAGMFARGEFEIGVSEVMTLPQSAVQLRDGFSHVMRVGPNSRVIQTKVTTGRRSGNRIEIVSGLNTDDRVVVTGAAFLGDGDVVIVSVAPTAAPATGSSPTPGRRQTMASIEGVR